MTKNYYNKLFNNIPSNNKVLGILNRTSSKEEDKLSKELINIDGVSGVVFNTVSKQTFSNTIKNLNYVVLIMIISAGALAFVVLYNLTNVNISERIREIATIKVLGFYDGETAAYIYRENIILTIVGIIVGLIMGKFLHQYIMTTVEIKSMRVSGMPQVFRTLFLWLKSIIFPRSTLGSMVRILVSSGIFILFSLPIPKIRSTIIFSYPRSTRESSGTLLIAPPSIYVFP